MPYTFHKHRQWHGTLSRITIKRDSCGDYWLCITTTYTDFRPLPATGKRVGADNVIQGMDLVYPQTKSGMKDAYLTLSTGEKKQHLQPLKQSLNKLRCELDIWQYMANAKNPYEKHSCDLHSDIHPSDKP